MNAGHIEDCSFTKMGTEFLSLAMQTLLKCEGLKLFIATEAALSPQHTDSELIPASGFVVVFFCLFFCLCCCCFVFSKGIFKYTTLLHLLDHESLIFI